MLYFNWLENKMVWKLTLTIEKYWQFRLFKPALISTHSEYSELFLIVLLCWNLICFNQNINYPLQLVFHKLTLFDMGFLNRQSLGEGGGMRAPPSWLCCYCSDDHEIWHRYQAWCVLHNGNKKFVTSLLLHNYDVITCILVDTYT